MDYLGTLADQLEIGMGMLWLFMVIMVWSAVWKLLALWKSARKGHLAWFIILGLVNLVGILEILYIFIFSELKYKPTARSARKKKRK